MTNEITSDVTCSQAPQVACLAPSVEIGIYANVPLELREMRIWMPFISKPRANEKMGKAPVNRNGYLANWRNPESLMSFHEALSVKRNLDLPGIGIVFRRELGLYGYDADDVLENEELKSRTLAHLKFLGTYAETSLSGNGIHAIGRGVPPGEQHKCEPYEIYSDRRFFVMTGRAIPGMPATLKSNQPALDVVYREIFGPEDCVPDSVREYVTGQIPANALIQQVVEPVSIFALDTQEKEKKVSRAELRASLIGPTSTDEEVINLMRSEKTGIACHLYFKGVREGKNPSNEDWVLTGKLYFYTRGNLPQVYRMFKASTLYRSKCDEPRGLLDYVAYTIGRYLIKGNRAMWNPGRHAKQAVSRKAGRPQSELVTFAIALHLERPELLPSEISNILNLPCGSVRNALSRYHKKLKRDSLLPRDVTVI